MRTLLRFVLTAVFAGALAAGPACGQPPVFDPPNRPGVVITLHPMILARRSSLCVEDVAALEGGDPALRKRLGRLDLIDLPPSGAEAAVSREQVAFRLLLAGVKREHFTLQGAPVVLIRQPPAVLYPEVVHVAHRQQAAGEREGRARDDSQVLIRKRDVVQLVLRIGNLQVTTRGEALEDGSAGDRIRVRNIDSSRVISGKVVDRGNVEVDLDGSKR